MPKLCLASFVVALVLAVVVRPAQGLDAHGGSGSSGRGFAAGTGSTGIVSGNGIIGYNNGVGIQVGSSNSHSDSRCPRMCTCSGQTVDCSNRGLGQVPRRIPVDTERL